MKKNFCVKAYFGVLLILVAYVSKLQGQNDHSPKRFRLPLELNEVSGLAVASGDSLWWHNDSGNGAEIFLTNGAGALQQQIPLPIKNYDWEDLTTDTDGRLYLGDFGDNRRRREELRIYRYDPRTSEVDSFSFHYPDGKSYDTEAFFWHRDTFHLFTKSRISRADLMTYHFVLPVDAGLQTATLRDSLAIRKRAVTAAAIHPETGTVALLAYYYTKRLGFIPYSAANVYFFENYPEGHFLQGDMKSRRISLLVATQYESLDFIDHKHLLVASEQTLIIKTKAKRIRRKR
ncbi:MAG: hypothetical protein AAF485_30030 [Chloroflexota bacterium]